MEADGEAALGAGAGAEGGMVEDGGVEGRGMEAAGFLGRAGSTGAGYATEEGVSGSARTEAGESAWPGGGLTLSERPGKRDSSKITSLEITSFLVLGL